MEYKIGFLVSATRSNNGCSSSVSPPLDYRSIMTGSSVTRESSLSILSGVGYFVVTETYRGKPIAWIDAISGQQYDVARHRIDMKVIADIGPKLSEWPAQLRKLKIGYGHVITQDNLFRRLSVVSSSNAQAHLSERLAKQPKGRVSVVPTGVLNMTLSPGKRKRLRDVRRKLAKSHFTASPGFFIRSSASPLGGVFIDALAFLALTTPLIATGSMGIRNPSFSGGCQFPYDGNPGRVQQQYQLENSFTIEAGKDSIIDLLLSAKTKEDWELQATSVGESLINVCSFVHNINKAYSSRAPLPRTLLALPSLETVSAQTAINTRKDEYVPRKQLYTPFVKELSQSHSKQYEWHTYPYKTHIMLIPTSLVVAMAYYYTDSLGKLDSDLVQKVLLEEMGAEGLFLRKGQITEGITPTLPSLFNRIMLSTDSWAKRPPALVPYLANRHQLKPQARYNPAGAKKNTPESLELLLAQLEHAGPDAMAVLKKASVRLKKEMSDSDCKKLDELLAIMPPTVCNSYSTSYSTTWGD